MIGVRPCPYCGGEVEVIKLSRNADERKQKAPQPFRIQCYKCHATVARGRKYPNESIREGEERIHQYEEYMDNLLKPGTSYKIQQSAFAKQRDRHAALASRIGKDDEAMEVHDVANPRGHHTTRGIGEFDT